MMTDMRKTLIERTENKVIAPPKRVTPFVQTSRLENLSTTGDAGAHAMMLTRVSTQRGSSGDLLLNLQRRQGNRHVQRVVALARRSRTAKLPGERNIIRRQAAD